MIPADHDWLDVLGAISGLLLGLGGMSALVTAILYIWKIRPERRQIKAATNKTQAEAVDLYEQVAARAAERALKTNERISALEAALEIKDKRIDELEAAGVEKDQKIDALERQVHELQDKIAALEAERAKPVSVTKGRTPK